jgi:hypothetical protein
MEDDMFLDDDLDDIPDNTLLELEQNAISSTQKQKSSQPPPPAVNLRKQAHNASSLYRSQKATNNIAWLDASSQACLLRRRQDLRSQIKRGHPRLTNTDSMKRM